MATPYNLFKSYNVIIHPRATYHSSLQPSRIQTRKKKLKKEKEQKKKRWEVQELCQEELASRFRRYGSVIPPPYHIQTHNQLYMSKGDVHVYK